MRPAAPARFPQRMWSTAEATGKIKPAAPVGILRVFSVRYTRHCCTTPGMAGFRYVLSILTRWNSLNRIPDHVGPSLHPSSALSPLLASVPFQPRPPFPVSRRFRPDTLTSSVSTPFIHRTSFHQHRKNLARVLPVLVMSQKKFMLPNKATVPALGWLRASLDSSCYQFVKKNVLRKSLKSM